MVYHRLYSRWEMDLIQADFDQIARSDSPGWDHNNHYHPFLLRHIDWECEEALDIGCGKGDFARQLALRVNQVLAIDLSPEMIRAAGEQSRQYPNIHYQVADVMQWDWPLNRFDYVVSIATLHHLPLELMLSNMKMALKPGGKLLVLDLYQQEGHPLSDLLAMPLSKLLKLITNTRLRDSAQTRAAWAEHAGHDSYLPLSQIRTICAEVLPGST